MSTHKDSTQLTRQLMKVRDDLNAAVACSAQGDLFGAGAHYRAAVIGLDAISEEA